MPFHSELVCGHWLYQKNGKCACPQCQPFTHCPNGICCRNDGVVCPDDVCDRELEIWPDMKKVNRMSKYTPVVVAFTGKRGSGKSEASNVLIDDLGFVELKFADPMKNMLRALYDTCGVDTQTIERKIEGDLKEVPCALLCGATPRRAMQTLGTEWRDGLNPELDENDEPLSRPMWALIFKSAVESGKLGDRIVCSDYRFPAEGRALDELGAVKYRITRPEADSVSDEASQHASETLIDQIPTDLEIENDGTVQDLHDAVIDYVRMGLQIAAPTTESDTAKAISHIVKNSFNNDDGIF